MRIIMLSLVALPSVVSAGCASSEDAHATLSTTQWRERLDATPGAFVLDVRTTEEYRSSHIPGSVLIPYTDIESRSTELPSDKSAPVFVYCRSGSRSAIASETLAKLRYTNIVNMDGSFPDWERAGYPTETGA